MNFKKLAVLLIAVPVSLAGCLGIGPNATYYMGTTSFHYPLSYSSYMVKLNGAEIGGGFGKSTNVAPIKVGVQAVTWKDTNTGELHTAKNQLVINKEQLKGKKYLALHMYPDDTVEVTTSDDLPDPTEKGLVWLEKQRSQEVKEGKIITKQLQ
ncbi:hypothetical protein [Acinetobacter sp. NIPH 2699]|uniref:hypothetical protein n=1 Tax=Acinetobacter sp. NIPH 2699 TaxID=2923433 RepID=UPI001F4A0CEC|nr:hypothetical protein [Acinetobacter sp. NIPH 2699]MCH7335472.1 hypothetical protein [Acinetobacter sp. NIPH 2699]